jgi:endonuclease YncB( thermonuclease family)
MISRPKGAPVRAIGAAPPGHDRCDTIPPPMPMPMSKPKTPWRAAASAASAALLGLAALTAAAAPPKPAPIEGVVTKVVDGDTLLLQPVGQAPIDVRIRDIDAPEICQAWGPEAKQALEEMALGKPAQLQSHGRDSWGRTIGTLTIDGQNLGKRMVEEGHAWSVRTRWDNGPLVKQERQAQALRRGLHATPGAQMPKDFRREKGSCPRP